jgi:hypothetical protein
MPWCPRCDETFPEGPACPRCNARLIQRDPDGVDTIDELRSVPAVRGVHVSRRHRRALERLSAPRTRSLRLLAFSIVALVFVSGFLLGRFAGIGPVGEPTVHGLAPADPVKLANVTGSVAYSLWTDTDEPLATIAQHDVRLGDVEPLARLSPWAVAGPIKTTLVSYGRSVALVANDGMNSFVAFVAAGSPAYGWVPGVEAAWASEHEVYVRAKDGTVTKWSPSSAGAPTTTPIRATRIFQTPSGAVAQTERGLEAVGTEKVLAAPRGARVLAVAPGADRALVDHDGPSLWDGTRFVPVHVEGYEVLAGSFESSGQRVAMTLRKDGVLTVAVVDRDGNASLKPLSIDDRDCAATPAWDAAGHWLYVAPGNGSLYAIGSAGPEIRRVETHSVGCGLAWLAA